MGWLSGRGWRSARKAGGASTPTGRGTSETSASAPPTGTPTAEVPTSHRLHKLLSQSGSTEATSPTVTGVPDGEVHLEFAPGSPAVWVPNSDVLDPADEYDEMSDVPTHTEQEKHVSHKLTVTVTDEAHAALVAAAKKDESIQDTIRRLLHRSLKLPKPGK